MGMGVSVGGSVGVKVDIVAGVIDFAGAGVLPGAHETKRIAASKIMTIFLIFISHLTLYGAKDRYGIPQMLIVPFVETADKVFPSSEKYSN